MSNLQIVQITNMGEKTWVALSQATGQFFEFLTLEGAADQLAAIDLLGVSMVQGYSETLNAIPSVINMVPMRAPAGTLEMSVDEIGTVLYSLNDTLLYGAEVVYAVENAGEVLLEFIEDAGMALLSVM